MDQTQNKAREIDVIAEKSWEIKDAFGRWSGDVVARLFVECKFVPAHSVFWFTEKDQAAAEQLVCKTGGFRIENRYTKDHHYLRHRNQVAKIFASDSNRGQDSEPFYKALNQVLHAQVSMDEQPTAIPELNRQMTGIRVILNFPVVVCSSFEKMYAKDFYGDEPPHNIKENFQLEVQYAYTDRRARNRDEYFLIDFVEFAQLDKITAMIQKNAEVSAYLSSSG